MSDRSTNAARSLRTVLFWVHLAAGVTAGIVVLIMSVTGVLLAYERQLTERIDGPPPVPASTTARLTPDALLARAGLTAAEVGSITTSANPAVATLIRRRDRPPLAVDPFRGDSLAVGKPVIGPVFRALVNWHRWLGREGEGRATGRAVTGAANVAFLVIVISGFYLWWPRRWTKAAVRSVTMFNWRLEARARDFNWHNVIGFWSAPVLLILVVSGAFISYRWPARLLNRIFGDGPPPGAAASAPAATDSVPFGRPLDPYWAEAERQVPEWRTITMTIPAPGDTAVRFQFTTSDIRRPTDRASLLMSAATGAVLRFEPYTALSPTRKVQGWMRWLHTGEAGGWAGQTVAGVASLGACFLVVTGLLLSWRRLGAWRARRESRVPESATASATTASQ